MLRRWDNNANVISKISGKIPLGHVFSDVNPIIGKSQYLLSLEKDDGGNVLSSAVDVFLLYDDEVTLYPNPVQNEMKVWVGRNNRDKLIVNIYSIDEKLVKETNILKTRPYIDLKGLSAGIYIIQFIAETKIISKKIVIN